MPKIIKDAREKVLNAALSLFSSQGFGNVDMRSVARGAGVAVGTLYNYYPDKMSLFIGVSESRFRLLKERMALEYPGIQGGRDRLEYLVGNLYFFIKEHAGLWASISQDAKSSRTYTDEGGHRRMVEESIGWFSSAFNDCVEGKVPREWTERAGTLLVGAITAMIKGYPDDDGKNTAFIMDLVDGLLIKVNTELGDDGNEG